MDKTALMLLMMFALSCIVIYGQGQTDKSITSAMTTIPDYDITVNSDQNGDFVIGLRAEEEDCYVYFDDIKNNNMLVGTAQETSPPASTAPTADYITHKAGPEWGKYTVSELPSKVSIASTEGRFERSKDLIKYIPYAFNNNYYVNDSIIKDDSGNEIGLKIKIQYPKKLIAHETGALEVEVITKDFGNASQPDWQNNILSFCILRILSDENLSEEDEYVAGFADKGMSVTPVAIGIAAKPLHPIDYWIRYDDSLYQTIKRDHPEFVVTDEVIDATTALIGEVPIMSTTTSGEKTGGGILFTFADLLFTPLTGLDFDELLMAFAKWQVEYTVGNAPSDEFSDENHFDCWTYIFGFNVNENLCTGANGVRLNFPFSFDNEGEHEIKLHLDTMFEGIIPSLGVKGGRIGKEYTLNLQVGQSLPDKIKVPEVEWEKKFWDEGTDRGNATTYSVLATADGGFLLVYDDDNYQKYHCREVHLVKTDSMGDEIWRKTFGGTDSSICLVSVEETSDGDLILAGSYVDINKGDTSYSISGGWLAKISITGNLIWEKKFPSGEPPNIFFSYAKETFDNGFIIVGTNSSIVNDEYPLERGWLIRTNPSGEMIWDKKFGSYSILKNFIPNAYLYSVKETKYRGLILSGFNSTDSMGGRNLAWLIRTDASGNLIWDKTFGDMMNLVGETEDGGFILTGGTRDKNNDWMYWLIRIDSNGEVIWKKDFSYLSLSNYFDFEASKYILQTRDGNIALISGTKFSLIDPNGNEIIEETLLDEDDDILYTLHEEMDSGFIVGGIKKSAENGNFEGCLLLLDSSGNVKQKKTLEGGVYSIKDTKDGGHILAGEIKSDVSGYVDAWLIKLKAPEDSLS
jgi:hypothetical protein